MQLETRGLGIMVRSYFCSTYKVADPFSFLGAFSSFSVGGPVFHHIKPETLKLIEEKVRKNLEDMGTGEKFLNRTPMVCDARSTLL
jgi:hypothetical protein